MSQPDETEIVLLNQNSSSAQDEFQAPPDSAVEAPDFESLQRSLQDNDDEVARKPLDLNYADAEDRPHSITPNTLEQIRPITDSQESLAYGQSYRSGKKEKEEASAGGAVLSGPFSGQSSQQMGASKTSWFSIAKNRAVADYTIQRSNGTTPRITRDNLTRADAADNDDDELPVQFEGEVASKNSKLMF